MESDLSGVLNFRIAPPLYKGFPGRGEPICVEDFSSATAGSLAVKISDRKSCFVCIRVHTYGVQGQGREQSLGIIGIKALAPVAEHLYAQFKVVSLGG